MDVIIFILIGTLLGLLFFIGLYEWLGVRMRENRERLGIDGVSPSVAAKQRQTYELAGIFRTLYIKLKGAGVNDMTLLGHINQFASRCDGGPWKASQLDKELPKEEISLYDAALFHQAVVESLKDRPEGLTPAIKSAVDEATNALLKLTEEMGDGDSPSSPIV